MHYNIIYSNVVWIVSGPILDRLNRAADRYGNGRKGGSGYGNKYGGNGGGYGNKYGGGGGYGNGHSGGRG